MNIEILTDPNRPENRRGITSRVVQRAREGLAWWQIGLLGLALGLILLGVIQKTMLSEPERTATAASDPGQPAPHEPEWLPQHLQSLEPAAFGRMRWRDEPNILFETVRPLTFVERRGSRSIRVAVRASDGLWRIRSVREGEEIRGTNLRVARIDSHIAFARDEEQTLHRLFHPAQWEAFHETYGFSAEPPFSAFYVRLSKTPLWALPQGSRSLYQLELTTETGERISDERFARLVPALEQFAIDFERARKERDTVSGERMLRERLAERDREIRVEQEEIPPPLDER